jgi:predicted glycosyltransferase
MTVERTRRDFTALLAGCALSVSQAGYNTVLEVLRAGPPAVFVPFAAAGEREQSLRAELLAARGLASVVPEDGLSGASLAAGIAHALRQAPDRPRLDLAGDGAARTAEIVRERIAILPAPGA